MALEQTGPVWNPVETNLNTLYEFKNLSHTITYEDTLMGISYPVTITPMLENETVTIDGGTISGYFSDSFQDEINYRTKLDTFVTVNKFNQININTLYGIYHYAADTTRQIIYSYLAEANGAQKLYTITVLRDWSSGRNQLIKYTNLTEFQESAIAKWVNDESQEINWKNENNKILFWIKL